MSELIMEVKPKYNMLVRFVSNFEIAMRFSVLIAALCSMVGGLIGALNFGEKFAQFLNNHHDIYCFIVFGIFAIIYILVSIILLYLNKKNFEVTNYKVYQDRIEFEQGFINHKYTTLNMIDIKEIHLIQNFFQKKLGLGTIKFITAGNANNEKNRNLFFTGISFSDIENSLAIYTKIRQIHESK